MTLDAVDDEGPPIARLIDCSKSSRVELSSLLAASLKASGEEVAYRSNWEMVCVVTTVGVVWESDNKSAMVGSTTPKSRTPFVHSARRLRGNMELTMIFWDRCEERRKGFPHFTHSCDLRF